MLAGPTGLCLFDIGSKTFQPVELDIGPINIREILVDEEDRIWLATSRGLLEGNLSDDMRVHCLERINYVINDLLIDSNRRLWIVTSNNGVLVVDLDNIKPFKFRKYFFLSFFRVYMNDLIQAPELRFRKDSEY